MLSFFLQKERRFACLDHEHILYGSCAQPSGWWLGPLAIRERKEKRTLEGGSDEAIVSLLKITTKKKKPTHAAKSPNCTLRAYYTHKRTESKYHHSQRRIKKTHCALDTPLPVPRAQLK